MTQAVRVAVRTTAGERVGFGHLRRCLSLAGALRRQGVESVFLVDGPPIALKQVALEGFRGVAIAQADDPATDHIRMVAACAVVGDSYAFGPMQFSALGALGSPVIAIDDCGDRELAVELVVNSSAGAEQLPYPQSGKTKYLLGPLYALLRPEFGRPSQRKIGDQVRRVLITVGGGDPLRLTSRLVSWTARVLPETQVDVVVGPGFGEPGETNWDGAEPSCRVTYHHNPPDMRSLMISADLAICGGGQTTYELAATGTPALAVRVADNQTGNLWHLAAAGTLLWVGDAEDADFQTKLVRALTTVAPDVEARARMSTQGRLLVDGHGADRVALAVKALALGGNR